jgi:type III pantothenate kinase
MLLAIDVGNTNIVFAVYQQEKIMQFWRCQTIASRTQDEYAVFLHALFGQAGLQWTDISDVIVSSVVPEADFHLKRFCQAYFKRTPLFVSHVDVYPPIGIAIDQPEQVGADRIVNAVAVAHFYQVPAVVIDFGTATTFDVIDGRGRYCGGAIAPGVDISLSALHQAAAKLPRVSIKRPESPIGNDTVSAMRSGMYWGYAGLIEGVVNKITEALGEKPFVIATGGLASLYAGSTSVIEVVDEELTLKGLLRIHLGKQNKEKTD